MSKKVKRLFEGFRPAHYQLELDPARDSKRLSGTITITGQKAGRPSQRLTFHQKGLKITEATVIRHDKKGETTHDITRISHHTGFDEVRLHADEMLYPGKYTITLRFSGTITDGMHGIYPCYYEVNGQKKQLIATQFESHHAREAFPCIDEPEAKATFDLTLISPKGETVLSNMPIAQQQDKEGQIVTRFETTPKMPTYLLAFAYGDLQSKETKTKDGVDVRVWAIKAHPAAALDFALEVAKGSIEFFNRYFGVPYPLAKSDHIALPDFTSGAMENWGLITYRESCLLADPATTSQSTFESIATIIGHETSHQWFGNLVTMRWWDNLWLNESFANVMEYVVVDDLHPEWHVWNDFITAEGLMALRRDSIAGVQAVQTEVRHPDEIASIFDPSIVYAKGGRLLRMLMQYIGEGAFCKGLTAYFTKHAYANTTGDDLWRALGAASGSDVGTFMNPWLMRSGFPVVRVNQQGNKLTLKQEHFLLDPAKTDKTLVWPVPLLSDQRGLPALFDTKETEAQLETTDFVRINQGALGHYVVHYTEPEHMKAIAAMVRTKQLGVAERLMLLSDSSMLARSGEQSFARTLQLLEEYAKEDQEPVWGIMAVILADARRFIDTAPELEAPIKALIRKLIQTQFARLGWEEKPNEDSQDVKLRATITGLGVYAKDETVTQGALDLFAAYKKDASSVPAELRSIVFSAAVRAKVAGAFDYLLELEESTVNTDLKLDICGALTTCEQSEEVQTLLGRLKDADKVRPQDLQRWLAYLLRNRHARKASWKWLQDNWPWIEKTYDGDKSYDYFPRYAASAFNTPELLQEYKTFFEPKTADLALARNIVMGIEEIENRVAWLKRDLDSVRRQLGAA